MSDNPTDVGILLKQAREGRGIPLEAVHESTKVPMDALRAIEEGYRVRTLTAFYYKSFVKIYAQYLGLDANHVVSLIPTHHPKPPADVFVPRRVAVTASGVAHRVEGARARSLWAHPIVLKKKKKIFKAVMVMALAVGGFVLAGALVHKMMPAAGTRKKAVEVPMVKNQPVKMAPKKTAVTPPADVKPAPVVQKPVAPAPVAKQVSITVKAQTTTWVRVDVDDAGTAFQGRLKKGSAATWRATKKIVFSANDIGVLEFEVNGRSVGKLARNYLKAKRVIVTAEGLTVEK